MAKTAAMLGRLPIGLRLEKRVLVYYPLVAGVAPADIDAEIGRYEPL